MNEKSATTTMAIVCFSALALSCGGAGGPTECQTFREAYCGKQGSLCEGVTTEECVELFDATLDCDAAVGVDDSYEDCLLEVEALEECPADLPASCRGVIYTADER